MCKVKCADAKKMNHHTLTSFPSDKRDFDELQVELKNSSFFTCYKTFRKEKAIWMSSLS